MRAYKLWSAAASLALIAGCAGEDGKDGETGPAGAQGEQGEPGTNGTNGTNGTDGEDGTDGTNGTNGTNGTDGADGEDGEDGEDAACAANAKLVLNGVTGAADAVFPGEEVTITFDFAGAPAELTYQWIGMDSPKGGAVGFADPPADGLEDNEFQVTLDAEGDREYVAIVTDGCSVVTANFTVKARYAKVNVINLFAGFETGISVAESGSTDLLLGEVFFGSAFDDIFPGQAGFLYYFAPEETPAGFITTTIEEESLELDVYQADAVNDFVASGTIVHTTTLTKLNPDDRIIVVIHADAAGAIDSTIIRPDQADLPEDGTDARLQLSNFVPGTTASFAITDDFSDELASDVAFGGISAGVLTPVADLSGFIDLNGDNGAEYEVTLPLETFSVFPGEYVVAFTWLDANGQLQLTGHDTGGDLSQYEGQAFIVAGTSLPFLSETAPAATFANLFDGVDDLGLAVAGTKDLLVGVTGTDSTSAAPYETSLPSFAQIPLGTTGFDVYPADDTTGAPLATVTVPAAQQGDRTVVFAHEDADGLALSAVTPDFAPAAADSVAVQFLNLVDGPLTVDVSLNPDGSAPVADDVGYNQLSPVWNAEFDLGRIRHFVTVDGDVATIDLDAGDFLVGDHAIVVAYQDALGALQVAAYVAFAEDPANAPRFGLIVPLTLVPYSAPDFVGSVQSDLAIPDSPAPGVTSTLNVTVDCFVGAGSTISYALTHAYPGDIDLSLTSPDGTKVLVQGPVLAAAGELALPGNLIGEATLGNWTVTVQDVVGADVGTLDQWGLSIVCGEAPEPTTNEFTASAGGFTGTSTPNAPVADTGVSAFDTLSSIGNTCVVDTATVSATVSFTATSVPDGETPDYDVSDYNFVLSSPTGTTYEFGGFDTFVIGGASTCSTTGVGCTGTIGGVDLTDFAGEALNGDWVLEAYDSFTGYATTGVLTTWSLAVTCD